MSKQQLETMKSLFSKSCKAITAIGDETRQSIILALLEEPCEGMRVGILVALGDNTTQSTKI